MKLQNLIKEIKAKMKKMQKGNLITKGKHLKVKVVKTIRILYFGITILFIFLLDSCNKEFKNTIYQIHLNIPSNFYFDVFDKKDCNKKYICRYIFKDSINLHILPSKGLIIIKRNPLTYKMRLKMK